MPSNLEELPIRHVLGEVVARQFRAIAAVFCAVIDEAEHIQVCIRLRLAAIYRLEGIAEGIRRQAELKARRPFPIEWFNREEMRPGQRGEGA